MVEARVLLNQSFPLFLRFTPILGAYGEPTYHRHETIRQGLWLGIWCHISPVWLGKADPGPRYLPSPLRQSPAGLQEAPRSFHRNLSRQPLTDISPSAVPSEHEKTFGVLVLFHKCHLKKGLSDNPDLSGVSCEPPGLCLVVRASCSPVRTPIDVPILSFLSESVLPSSQPRELSLIWGRTI